MYVLCLALLLAAAAVRLSIKLCRTAPALDVASHLQGFTNLEPQINTDILYPLAVLGIYRVSFKQRKIKKGVKDT